MVKPAAAILGGLSLVLVGSAYAKLPPPSDEAKASAAEAKAKAEHGTKVAAYEACLAQNRIAARYLKEKGEKAQLPACENPGPLVAGPAPAGSTAQAAPPHKK